MRWLHRLGNDRPEIRGTCVQFDLLPEPKPEALERPLRVVAVAVEASVDEPLYSSARLLGSCKKRSINTSCTPISPPIASACTGRCHCTSSSTTTSCCSAMIQHAARAAG